jgi:hypothetical protein
MAREMGSSRGKEIRSESSEEEEHSSGKEYGIHVHEKGQSLKLLQLMLKAVGIVNRAIPFFKRGPPPLWQELKGKYQR